MKIKLVLATALALSVTVGCTSTSSVSSSDEDLLAMEPAIQLTVATQTMSEWPYSRANLTYTLTNRDITQNKAAGISKWKQMAAESLNARLIALGLTYKEQGPAKLSIFYGVTEPGESTASSDQIFNTIGLTAGGKNGSIEVSIVDNLTKRNIWSGSVSAESDKPLATEAIKKRVINSLIDSLTGRLPVAK